MPSWRINRKWGEEVCKFSSEDIDRLIDEPQGHDTGRYDKKTFLEQISYVSSKYGEKRME